MSYARARAGLEYERRQPPYFCYIYGSMALSRMRSNTVLDACEMVKRALISSHSPCACARESVCAAATMEIISNAHWLETYDDCRWQNTQYLHKMSSNNIQHCICCWPNGAFLSARHRVFAASIRLQSAQLTLGSTWNPLAWVFRTPFLAFTCFISILHPPTAPLPQPPLIFLGLPMAFAVQWPSVWSPCHSNLFEMHTMRPGYFLDSMKMQIIYTQFVWHLACIPNSLVRKKAPA